MKKQNKKALEAGLIAGGAVAALAGALFLYGTTEGKSAQKKIHSWTLKAKGEILEQIENAKNIDKEKYMKIVDKTIKKYKAKAKDGGVEIEALANNLKKHWNHIAKKHGLK